MKIFILLVVCLVEAGRASPVDKRQTFITYNDAIVPFAEYGLPPAPEVLVTPSVVAPVEPPKLIEETYVEPAHVYVEPPAAPLLQPLPEIQTGVVVESNAVEIPAAEYGVPVEEIHEKPAAEYGVPAVAEIHEVHEPAAEYGVPVVQSLPEIHNSVVVESHPIVVPAPPAPLLQPLPEIQVVESRPLELPVVQEVAKPIEFALPEPVVVAQPGVEQIYVNAPVAPSVPAIDCTSGHFVQYIPQQLPQIIHQQVPQFVPQQVSQFVSQQVPQFVPPQVSSFVSYDVPQWNQFALPAAPWVQPSFVPQPQVFLPPPTVAIESKLPVVDIPATVEFTSNSVVVGKPYPPAVEFVAESKPYPPAVPLVVESKPYPPAVPLVVESKPYPPAVPVVESKPYAPASAIPTHYGEPIVVRSF